MVSWFLEWRIDRCNEKTSNRKKCNLTLAMSPLSHSNRPELPIYPFLAINDICPRCKLLSRLILWLSFNLLIVILSEIWIIFYDFWSSPDRQQTESDAYEPTVQVAQVGSKSRDPFFTQVFSLCCSKVNRCFLISDRPTGQNWLVMNPQFKESTDHGLVIYEGHSVTNRGFRPFFLIVFSLHC